MTSAESFSLVRYRVDAGTRCGLLIRGRVFDVSQIADLPAYSTVREILADWDNASARFAAFAATGPSGGTSLEAVTLLTPVDEAGAIFGAGANFHDHNAAMAAALNLPSQPDPRSLGLGPWFFLKTYHTLAAPNAEVGWTGERMDWEAEIAAVIGRPARNVPVEDALSYIAAYTIANDLSARDRGVRAQLSHGSPFRPDWVAHKNFDGACPLGPALVPAAAVGDPQKLSIRLWVNDAIKQDSTSDQMVFSVAEQVSHLSTLVTLRPGDVILTGTPAGTGAETGEFLQRGDKIRIEIDKLGELETWIV